MSEMTPEDQHIHEIVESYTEPLKDEITELRSQVDALTIAVRDIRRDVHKGFEMPC